MNFVLEIILIVGVNFSKEVILNNTFGYWYYEKGDVFYLVRIKTNKNYIGDESRALKIIPGMTVSVDIITGQKSVLDYILKPILKTKQYTFTER